jgi:hypothetical protein
MEDGTGVAEDAMHKIQIDAVDSCRVMQAHQGKPEMRMGLHVLRGTA